MNRVYRLFRYGPSQVRIGQNCLFGLHIFRQILWHNLFDWHVLLGELDNHDLKLKQLSSGLCHLDRASNVEIGVDCQLFVIIIFFYCSRILQFRAHSRYYMGALSQKRSFFSDLYYFLI